LFSAFTRDRRTRNVGTEDPGRPGVLTARDRFSIPNFEVTHMLVQLFQWIKRLSTGTPAENEERYSQSFQDEESDVGRWTFMSVFIVFTLSLYIVAGLGYYAKVHVWDGMSEAQKEAVAKAMVVDTQYL
jgi:hypothetical protein